jgi:hypothetical protein
VTVKAWLTGHGPDLRYLAAILSNGEVQVAEDDGKYYMTAAELDRPPTGDTFYDVARKLITRVNGLARTQNPSFVPVDLTGAYDQDGAVTVVLPTLRTTIRVHPLSVTVTTPDGVHQPQSSPVEPGYLTLATRNSDVAEVLEIVGQPSPPHFPELYKVYEIIEDSGSLQAAALAAGISQN